MASPCKLYKLIELQIKQVINLNSSLPPCFSVARSIVANFLLLMMTLVETLVHHGTQAHADFVIAWV